MKTQFEYIEFVKEIYKGKTLVWSCRDRSFDLAEIGRVTWSAGYEQYCYIPTMISNKNKIITSVHHYTAGCLRDIKEFLKELNVQHYAKAEASPSACPKG